jgi:hypothetical protein
MRVLLADGPENIDSAGIPHATTAMSSSFPNIETKRVAHLGTASRGAAGHLR